MHTSLRALLVLVSTHAAVHAQCPVIDHGFADPTLNAVVFAATTFDAGTGPALYVGGVFTVANGVTIHRVARFTDHFEPLGAGVSSTVLALCVFDDGHGPALYAGGDFTDTGGIPAAHVARWNGATWTALGSGTDGSVHALRVFDDGTGPALYAGGAFASAGGVTASNIARWNGTSWSPLGEGASGSVDALEVFDSGVGPALVAGGQFLSAGVAPARNVARWNGTAWSILGNGTNGRVRAFTVHGGALYAGGDFTTAGGLPAARVARWNGSAWSNLGSGTDQSVHALQSFDFGSGPVLVAGGPFLTAGSVAARAVAQWDGSVWSPVGEGLGGGVESFCADTSSGTPRLVAAGNLALLPSAGLIKVTRFDGTHWRALSQGLTPNYVTRIAAADDGRGKKIWASGLFEQAGGVQSNHLVRWVDGAWENPGPPGEWLGSIATHDFGAGPRVIAGGGYTSLGGVAANSVAAFDGASWSPLGQGLNGSVYSLGEFDDGNGSKLYAGGTFTASGSTQARYIARFDGSAWTEVLGGLLPPSNQSYAIVRGMKVFDDGTGPALYITGDFRRAGSVDALRIARFDGTSWSALGSGLDVGWGNDLAVFDDGSGPALFAGGEFHIAGGVSVNHLAKWNGTAWSAIGAGTSSTVYGLAVFDDGSGHGSALYVATASEGILRWDGTALTTFAFQSMLSEDHVQTLAVMPAHDGMPAELWAGGTFDSMSLAPSTSLVPSMSIARFVACDGVGTVFCAGDGSGTACPCGNVGAAEHGCASSFNAQGGHLGARGNPSVSDDSIVLEATGISNAVATIFQGMARVNGGAGAVFGDGLRCAGGTTTRIAAVQASANVLQYPHAADVPVSVRGQLPASGGKRTYQVWYRNAVAFCTSATFTFTNGLELTWNP